MPFCIANLQQDIVSFILSEKGLIAETTREGSGFKTGATRRARPRAAHGVYRKSIAYDSRPERPYLFCAKNVRFL